jgi:hypothetical protein
MSQDRTQYYHNKGQQDAAAGTYQEPHGLSDTLTTWGNRSMETNVEENQAYKDGWLHTYNQKK